MKQQKVDTEQLKKNFENQIHEASDDHIHAFLVQLPNSITFHGSISEAFSSFKILLTSWRHWAFVAACQPPLVATGGPLSDCSARVSVR